MAVTTSIVPAAIDGLLALIRGLTAVTASNIPVYDGLPGPEPGDVFVQVGGVDPATVIGRQDWLSIGSANGTAPAREQRFEIYVYVSAYVGGANAGLSGTSDAQKSARDQVYTIYQAIETQLRTDPVGVTALGGQGFGTGWWGIGTREDWMQTTEQDPEAGLGRRTILNFTVDCFKRLYS